MIPFQVRDALAITAPLKLVTGATAIAVVCQPSPGTSRRGLPAGSHLLARIRLLRIVCSAPPAFGTTEHAPEASRLFPPTFACSPESQKLLRESPSVQGS